MCDLPGDLGLTVIDDLPETIYSLKKQDCSGSVCSQCDSLLTDSTTPNAPPAAYWDIRV